MDGVQLPQATGPLRGGGLLFTTNFPEIPGTQFIDLEGMKGWVDTEPTSGLEHASRFS